jgi:S-adenosylmethionine:tRNA ribosyltransferase-isomerase
LTKKDPFSIDAYDYELPAELIAQEPLPERDASRLLVLERSSGGLRHRTFADLPELLSSGDLLVTNRSRVLPARLLGRRSGGGEAEILLVRPREPHLWDAMVRPGRRLRAGAVVEIAAGFQVRIEGDSGAAAAGSHAGGPMRTVRLVTEGDDPRAAIERHGHVPLPPYIRRPDRADDRERYQTVYAREPGSVAAPTAGLHFTSELLGRLDARCVTRAELVLHVGPGTFRPVEVDDVREHRVDAELFTIPTPTAATVSQARREGRRIVAVGTTTTRALESALTPEGSLRAGGGQTDLVITPGYPFRVVDGLVTNFHLPRSSLLLLVCAFAGRENLLAAYREAVRERYRFYSYGDAMLII